ncbi:restriction endonuclease subunit S, partial [Bifidobacterium sp. UTBIF-56]|uniref:restriction endonuclease subunit S n=1 Tax=Bifidobacterium sp. UTBIF-56 TaxID=1465261 RepID=UPI00112B5A45
MGERTVVRLGDVCHIVSGTTPNSTKPEYWDGGLPWVTPAEISNDSHIITDTQRTLTEAGVLSKKLPLLPKGTVLLSSRAPIGKVAIAGRDMYCNQGFKNLICSDAIFNEYLYCFLKSQNKRLQHMGHGATFKELSKKTLSDMMIPVPSLDVQHEIVSTLEAASRLTDVAKQMLDKADELIQSRFVEMFGDQSWDEDTLKSRCMVITGNTPSRKHSEYYGNNLEWIKTDNITAIGVKEAKERLSIAGRTVAKIVPPNSLLMVCIAGSVKSIGRVSIVDREVAFNQQINAIVPCEDVSSIYLLWALRNSKKKR